MVLCYKSLLYIDSISYPTDLLSPLLLVSFEYGSRMISHTLKLECLNLHHFFSLNPIPLA